MLLYARVTHPKPPKRRSRTGCQFCGAQQKKKCDEGQPQCTRCQQYRQDCHYDDASERERPRSNVPLDGLLPATTTDYSCAPEGVRRLPLRLFPTGDSVLLANATERSNWNTSDEEKEDETTSSAAEEQSSPVYATMEQIAMLGKYPRPSCKSGIHLNASNIILASIPRFSAASYSDFSEDRSCRYLIDHFCRVLSPLIVLWEDDANPFLQLILPLTCHTQAVSDAIYAFASAHLEGRGISSHNNSLYYYQRAITGLIGLTERGGFNKNELLAASILLVYYEVLVNMNGPNLVHGHLKAILAVANSREPTTNPTTAFLERAFHFFDVIVALSSGNAPHCTQHMTRALEFLPIDSRGRPAETVDALLGITASLWPVLYRLSSLLPLRADIDAAENKCEYATATRLRCKFNSMCEAVHIELNAWWPATATCNDSTGEFKTPESLRAEQKRLQSVRSSAMAYKHSALVYLYRTIYSCSSSDSLVQYHTHLSLLHCEAAAKAQGPMGSLLWPLFVSACEALTPEDREIAEHTFMTVNRIQGMSNITQSWETVQRVWQHMTSNDKMGSSSEVLSASNRFGYHGDLGEYLRQHNRKPIFLG